ncbi:uncharacterized protein J3R85_014470 [Psidium guajava]|nr:uncharacterized protein J3R85_014470 [Psidium guajava]
MHVFECGVLKNYERKFKGMYSDTLFLDVFYFMSKSSRIGKNTRAYGKFTTREFRHHQVKIKGCTYLQLTSPPYIVMEL